MAESLSPELALVDPELAERARAELADGGSAPPSAPGPGPARPKARSRGKWTAIVVGIAVLAGLAGLGAVWRSHDGDSSEKATPRTTRSEPVRAATAKERRRDKPTAPPRPLRPPLRPPAFHVAGAPKEPLREIALPVRARRLSAWLTPGRSLSRAHLHHWLYQHNWIVTGAKFGWWRGAAALRTLIRVDRRVESQWGVGYRSEAIARQALAEVEARGR